MTTLSSYLLIATVAASVTFAATPAVGLLARRQGWMYLPDDRTVHQTPLPDVGGLAMFAGMVAALVTSYFLGSFDIVLRGNSEPIGVLAAATIIFGVGFVDDVKDISAPAKLTGTVLAGLALVWSGAVMSSFRLPFYDPIILSDDLKPIVTLVWLLGMTQAINLIDGLDGLAAGIVAISAFAFFLYSQELNDAGLLRPGSVGPLFAIIAVGMCVGFLPHNVSPARIFMGGSGALLLGLLLAVSTSVIGGRADSFSNEFIGQTYFFLAPLAIPVLILGVPIVDTLFEIVLRADSRTTLAATDKGDLHHRLMHLGHGHRRSVVILWAWTALLSAFVLYPTLIGSNPTYLSFGIVLLGIQLYIVFHPSVRALRREVGPDESGQTAGVDGDPDRGAIAPGPSSSGSD